MSESSLNPEKPFAVTAVCVIGLINATQMINLVLSPMSKQFGAVYPVYFTAAVIVSLACIAGLWFMKKWAALVYSAVLICNQLVLVTMGLWEFTAVVIPVVIIALLIKHLDKMT